MRFLDRFLLSVVLLFVVAVPCLAQSGSFGSSVVVGEDELIIGEPNTFFRPGTVYVYRQSGGDWVEAEQLQAPDAERADGFGTVLAVVGNTLVVGQRLGPLHAFEREGVEWRHAGTLAGTEGIGIQAPEEESAEIPVGCNQYGYCETDFGVTLAAAENWLQIGRAHV